MEGSPSGLGCRRLAGGLVFQGESGFSREGTKAVFAPRLREQAHGPTVTLPHSVSPLGTRSY